MSKLLLATIFDFFFFFFFFLKVYFHASATSGVMSRTLLTIQESKAILKLPMFFDK